jgi:hypothetical protein
VRRALFPALLAALALGACARRPPLAPRPTARAPAPSAALPAAPAEPGRDRAAFEAGFERSKEGTAFLPLLGEDEAHAAMPSLYPKRRMPYLVRVGGLQPRTMEALLGFARTMRKEGGLGGPLLNDVFWEVSSANDCFY